MGVFIVQTRFAFIKAPVVVLQGQSTADDDGEDLKCRNYYPRPPFAKEVGNYK